MLNNTLSINTNDLELEPLESIIAPMRVIVIDCGDHVHVIICD